MLECFEGVPSKLPKRSSVKRLNLLQVEYVKQNTRDAYLALVSPTNKGHAEDRREDICNCSLIYWITSIL